VIGPPFAHTEFEVIIMMLQPRKKALYGVLNISFHLIQYLWSCDMYCSQCTLPIILAQKRVGLVIGPPTALQAKWALQ